MALRFRHVVLDPDPPGEELDVVLTADLTGNGLPDVIIGGKFGAQNLLWYENPGWARHFAAVAPGLEAGGALLDLDGDGRLEVIVGQQWDGRELYWFAPPADPREPWTRRLITDRFLKYHDQLVGDVDSDGEPELIFVSQRAGVLAYFDLPDDPTVEPWPEACLHVISHEAHDLEGLALADLDGDGEPELIAGPNVFKRSRGGWSRRCFAPDYVETRVAVADFDGDGRPELILAEGEASPARVAVCAAPDYAPRVLADDLFHPHSLGVADFDGDGRPDFFVGEMGLGKHAEPKLIVYRNLGDLAFEAVEISRGIPTHEAKAVDLTGDGRPDIVGKPYMPERHVDVWFNEG